MNSIAIVSIGIIVGILAIVGLILFFIKKKEKDKKEAEVTAMIDNMTMRRAAINTKYIEKDFFKSIEQLTYSMYAQDPNYIPNHNIDKDLYMELYNGIKREFDLGVKKQLIDFKMEKARVTKQNNSSMYAVTHIDVEGEFKIDYNYYHVTMNKRVIKHFKQKFVFLNTNDSWVLEKVLPEEVLNIQEDMM